MIFESPSLEDKMISFQDAINVLLQALDTDCDDAMKESWAKLGFDEFM